LKAFIFAVLKSGALPTTFIIFPWTLSTFVSLLISCSFETQPPKTRKKDKIFKKIIKNF